MIGTGRILIVHLYQIRLVHPFFASVDNLSPKLYKVYPVYIPAEVLSKLAYSTCDCCKQIGKIQLKLAGTLEVWFYRRNQT
jgi:hypothetical protein